MPRPLTRALLRASVALAVAVPLGAPAVATAAPAPARDLTVMTRNLYLGSDLHAAMTATDPVSLLTAVAQIYGTSLFTSFPARSAALAEEVATQHPDVIGLEEVSRWTVTGPTPRSWAPAACTTRWRRCRTTRTSGRCRWRRPAAGRSARAPCGSRTVT